jgi:hypothetical protein
MSGFRIAANAQTFSPPKRPAKKPAYLEYIRRLPCVVTGQYGVEAAHLSTAYPAYGHYGRGKGTKSSDRWALPLHPDEHRRQHSQNEMDYWNQTKINPHRLALVLFGIWSDYDLDTAVERGTALIRAGRDCA